MWEMDTREGSWAEVVVAGSWIASLGTGKEFVRSENSMLTLLVCVLIPIRVARYVRRALLLLLAAALEHLLEELELGEGKGGEEGEEQKS